MNSNNGNSTSNLSVTTSKAIYTTFELKCPHPAGDFKARVRVDIMGCDRVVYSNAYSLDAEFTERHTMTANQLKQLGEMFLQAHRELVDNGVAPNSNGSAEVDCTLCDEDNTVGTTKDEESTPTAPATCSDFEEANEKKE